jgi:hypothetical protein
VSREAVLGRLQAEEIAGASSPTGIGERIQTCVAAFSVDLTEETLLLFPERLFGVVVGPIGPEANDPNLRGNLGIRARSAPCHDRQNERDDHERNPEEPQHG